MRSTRVRQGLLVVVELGAEWPEWLANAHATRLRRVVAEVEAETPERFGVRCAALMGRVFPARTSLVGTIVACNERTDQAAMAARRTIARAAIERTGPSGTLTFSAGARAGGRLRHALSALALELGSEAFASVSVSFADELERPSFSAIARVA